MEGDSTVSPQSWPFFKEYAERILGPKVAQLAEEIGRQHEQAIWEELARRLQAEPGIPSGNADELRRWLQNTMGLTLAIRAQARFTHSGVIDVVASPPRHEPAVPAASHAATDPHHSAGRAAQRHPAPIERELAQRPTTTNPLAMAVAGFSLKR